MRVTLHVPPGDESDDTWDELCSVGPYALAALADNEPAHEISIVAQAHDDLELASRIIVICEQLTKSERVSLKVVLSALVRMVAWFARELPSVTTSVIGLSYSGSIRSVVAIWTDPTREERPLQADEFGLMATGDLLRRVVMLQTGDLDKTTRDGLNALARILFAS